MIFFCLAATCVKAVPAVFVLALCQCVNVTSANYCLLPEQSTVKFAPTSFLDSNRFLDTDETLYDVELYGRIIRGEVINDVFQVSYHLLTNINLSWMSDATDHDDRLKYKTNFRHRTILKFCSPFLICTNMMQKRYLIAYSFIAAWCY